MPILKGDEAATWRGCPFITETLREPSRTAALDKTRAFAAWIFERAVPFGRPERYWGALESFMERIEAEPWVTRIFRPGAHVQDLAWYLEQITVASAEGLHQERLSATTPADDVPTSLGFPSLADARAVMQRTDALLEGLPERQRPRVSGALEAELQPQLLTLFAAWLSGETRRRRRGRPREPERRIAEAVQTMIRPGSDPVLLRHTEKVAADLCTRLLGRPKTPDQIRQMLNVSPSRRRLRPAGGKK